MRGAGVVVVRPTTIRSPLRANLVVRSVDRLWLHRCYYLDRRLFWCPVVSRLADLFLRPLARTTVQGRLLGYDVCWLLPVAMVSMRASNKVWWHKGVVAR